MLLYALTSCFQCQTYINAENNGKAMNLNPTLLISMYSAKCKAAAVCFNSSHCFWLVRPVLNTNNNKTQKSPDERGTQERLMEAETLEPNYNAMLLSRLSLRYLSDFKFVVTFKQIKKIKRAFFILFKHLKSKSK